MIPLSLTTTPQNTHTHTVTHYSTCMLCICVHLKALKQGSPSDLSFQEVACGIFLCLPVCMHPHSSFSVCTVCTLTYKRASGHGITSQHVRSSRWRGPVGWTLAIKGLCCLPNIVLLFCCVGAGIICKQYQPWSGRLLLHFFSSAKITAPAILLPPCLMLNLMHVFVYVCNLFLPCSSSTMFKTRTLVLNHARSVTTSMWVCSFHVLVQCQESTSLEVAVFCQNLDIATYNCHGIPSL